MPKLTDEIIHAAIDGYLAQKTRLDQQIADLRELLHPKELSVEEEGTPQPQKRTMSAAGRRAIAKAQRARWAKTRGEAKKTTGIAMATEQPKKKKRKLSAAGRAAIIAATKRRWAKVRRAQNTKTMTA